MAEGAPSGSRYPDRPLPSGLVTAAWKGRRWRPDGTDVFCGDRSNQPRALFETAHFFAVPDLYPITPGHILIIPKAHYPAYAATPQRYDRELEWVVGRVSNFLRDQYGGEPMVWENGGPGAGQSVHHAHLHLIPMPPTVSALPPRRQAVTTSGMALIRAWWRSQRGGRPYHLMELGSDRRLLPVGSPDVREATLFKAQVLGIPVSGDGRYWLRKQNPVEVARTQLLWQRWDLAHPVATRHVAPTPPSEPDRGLAA